MVFEPSPPVLSFSLLMPRTTPLEKQACASPSPSPSPAHQLVAERQQLPPFIHSLGLEQEGRKCSRAVWGSGSLHGPTLLLLPHPPTPLEGQSQRRQKSHGEAHFATGERDSTTVVWSWTRRLPRKLPPPLRPPPHTFRVTSVWVTGRPSSPGGSGSSRAARLEPRALRRRYRECGGGRGRRAGGGAGETPGEDAEREGGRAREAPTESERNGSRG